MSQTRMATQVSAWVQALLAREPEASQRRAMAKVITLIESTLDVHRAQAEAVLAAVLPHTGRAFRIGISGVPGAGKSTLIEALGLYLIGQGHRVAVLAVDPSSQVHGGSILGDKTRMEKLAAHPQAFIRPSPSGGVLGGVAEKTREAMLVCEAAGYDVILVETVGVGQSETAVASMTDMLVLLQLPYAGDDLQAIKKGVLEQADVVLVNKADVDAQATQQAMDYLRAGLRSSATKAVAVLPVSALHGTGLDDFWQAARDYRAQQEAAGQWLARRQQQALAWVWERIHHGLQQAFRNHPQVQQHLPGVTQAVLSGQMLPMQAAQRLLAAAHIPKE